MQWQRALAGRVGVSSTVFFCAVGFCGDCFNLCAAIAETFLASSQLNATEFQMGALGSLSALGYAVTCVWAGMLSDRCGRRRICMLGVAGMALACLAAARAATVWQLCAASLVRSAATGFLWPSLIAWLADSSRHDSLPGLLGRYNIAWSSGLMLGFWIGGWAFQRVGPTAPFLFAAGLGLFVLALLAACSPRPAPASAAPQDACSGNARFHVRQGMTLLGLASFVGALALYMFPKIAGDAMGEAAQGLLQGIRFAGVLAAFLVFTWTRSWHFRAWPAWLALASFAAASAVIALAADWRLCALGFACMGVGTGIAYSMSAYYTLRLVDAKGLGGGVQEALIGGGNCLGPLFGGAVAAAISPRASVAACLAVTAVGAIAVRPWRPPPPGEAPAAPGAAGTPHAFLLCQGPQPPMSRHYAQGTGPR